MSNHGDFCSLYETGRQITQFPPGRMSYDRLQEMCRDMERDSGMRFDWYTITGWDVVLTDASDEKWNEAMQAVISAVKSPHGGFYVRKSPPVRAISPSAQPQCRQTAL